MLPCIDVPPVLKAIQPYIKTAAEHEERDPVIAYWCCMFGLQSALKIDKKSKEAVGFLTAAMDWLEKVKREHKDNEAIHNEVVAQAYVETYAMKLFLWADGEDRAANFNKNVVKAFYSAGMIFDILSTFGEFTDEVAHHRKYAKWKATYIHNCLKSGEMPIPGPMAGSEEGDEFREFESGRFQPPASPPSINTPYTSDTSLLPPTSGCHAPPSTPSGSTHPSPSSSRAEHFVPSQQTHVFNGVTLNAEDFHKAQKFCKFAGSALQYEDVATAVDNLQKALLLLTTGKEQ